MTGAAIVIQDVKKRFGSYQALENVSVDIREGEFFSLLGPSGCGKTTLLRMIAGFEFPSSGSVFVGGQDMTGIGPHKRPVNMVFQSYALFPHLSIFDNVAFGLRLSKVAESEIKQRVTDALELVRLPHVVSRFPSELSGGQQQRVALARAIVNKPKVLLLDEPLSALDPKIRQEMQSELARFKRELDMTFVMVTHDQSEAFALSDRIAVMHSGKVEQIGTPEEIFASPRTAFVADFIGQTNLFSGQIVAESDEYCLVRISENLEIWANRHETSTVGAPVTIWLRTQSCDLVAGPEDSKGTKVNYFPCEIAHRSFGGVTSDFRLRLSGDHFLVATMESHEIDGNAGDRKHVRIEASAVRVIPT